MSKHTPGPWEFRRPHNQSEGIWARIPHLDKAAMTVEIPITPQLRVGEDGKVFALLAYESWNQFPSDNWLEMQAANARLIAAAPDMLSALERVLREFPAITLHQQYSIRIIAAAIKKATEGSNESG